MNKRITKLLYKYASISEEMDIKDLKKWWNSLNWHEKTRERKRMEEELGYVEGAETEQVTETVATEEGYAKVVEDTTEENEEETEEEKAEKKS